MVKIEEYLNQVDTILKNNSKVSSYDLDLLFMIYQGKTVLIDGPGLADKVIKDLFSLFNQEDVLIPYNFLDTPLGEIIMNVKYGIASPKKYYVRDVASLAGISKQAVLKDIKKENLNATMDGREWIVEERELNKYLVNKGKEPLSLYAPLDEDVITPDYEREEVYSVSDSDNSLDKPEEN